MIPSPSVRRLFVAAISFAIFGAAGITGPLPQALGAVTPHLVLILMENKEYTDVVGNPAASYINGTLIPASRVFTSYYASDHPSLPNYLLLSSATSSACVTDACPPGFDPSHNLFQQLDHSSISWKAYLGGMPSNCFASNFGSYLVRHNPPVYYSDLSGGSCARNDVPLTRFASDLAAGTLPSFSWISPNKYDAMHSAQGLAPCDTGTTLANEVCQGDRWLRQNLPPLFSLNADADPNNDVTVVLTFDEGSTSQGGGGRILTMVNGPNVTPGHDATTYGHLGLLNAIEAWFGIPKLRPAVPDL